MFLVCSAYGWNEFPVLQGLRFWIEHHDHAPLTRFRFAGLDEPGAGVGAAGAEIGDVGVDRDRRGALGDQHLGELAQKRAAMAMSDHLRHADKGVDADCAGGKRYEMWLRPDVDGIGLGERNAVMLDDPLPHLRLVQVASEKHQLFLGLAPPAHDLGGLQPERHHRQIGASKGSEAVRRPHSFSYNSQNVPQYSVSGYFLESASKRARRHALSFV